MELELDFEDVEFSKSELRNALDAKRASYEAELRKEYRQHGLEYKSNSQVIGSGNSKDPMLYKIRKFILFHLIEHPHLAKRGAIKKMWDEKYTHILPYDKTITSAPIGKTDRREIIDKLKAHDMYRRISFKSTGAIIELIRTHHESSMLRREVAELKEMLSMYREGNNIVINGVVYRGDDNYYYLPKRVRKGAFNKAFETAIEHGLLEDTSSASTPESIQQTLSAFAQ